VTLSSKYAGALAFFLSSQYARALTFETNFLPRLDDEEWLRNRAWALSNGDCRCVQCVCVANVLLMCCGV
jgi:hypothetical protein